MVSGKKLVGIGSAIYASTTVVGRPIAEPTKAASIKILGVPVFVRDEAGDRTWFGLIHRGKSRRTKEALAAEARARGEQ